MIWLTIPLLLIMILAINWLSRAGNGGQLGEMIRVSNYYSWNGAINDAIDERERILDKEWDQMDDLADIDDRIQALRGCEPPRT